MMKPKPASSPNKSILEVLQMIPFDTGRTLADQLAEQLKAFLAQEVNKARIDELKSLIIHPYGDEAILGILHIKNRIKDLERLG